jgi:hypothetical protein
MWRFLQTTLSRAAHGGSAQRLDAFIAAFLIPI